MKALILASFLFAPTSFAATGDFVCSPLFADVGGNQGPFSARYQAWLNATCDKDKTFTTVWITSAGVSGCCIQK